MKFKRLSAAILAGVMCFGVFSTTAFAYVDENAVKEEPVVEGADGAAYSRWQYDVGR